MKTKVFDTYKAFSNREDKSVNGVSQRFAEENPNWQEMNKTNKGCWNCQNCNSCDNCEYKKTGC